MMIDHIYGRLISVCEDYSVVQAGGIGYRIYIANTGQPQLTQLKDDQIFYTYHLIREDTQALYGFFSIEDRDFFMTLMNVQGVGPKLAQKILSRLSTEQVAQAILENRIDILTQAPGVGKKLAEKLILELRDKISEIMPVSRSTKSTVSRGDLDPDLLLAMKTLGYSSDEIKRAYFKAFHLISPTTPLDVAIKTLLQHLG